MISNIIDKNIIKIISYLLISPGSRYTRKDLKEKTGMNNIPLDNTLKKLKSLKIIKEVSNLYYLNFEDEKAKNLLEIIQKEYKEFNLPYQIFNILLNIAEKLSKIKEIKEILLFGSYSKLIYSPKSDIDIAIIFYDKIKNKDKLEKKINKELIKISKKSKKQIEAHYFNDKDMNAKDPLVKDILKNNKRII